MKKTAHYECIDKIMDESHSLKTKVRELEISLSCSHERERDLEKKIKELERLLANVWEHERILEKKNKELVAERAKSYEIVIKKIGDVKSKASKSERVKYEQKK